MTFFSNTCKSLSLNPSQKKGSIKSLGSPWQNLLSDQCGGGDPTKPETYGVGVSTEILHLRQLARNTAWNSVAPNLGQWKDVSSEGNDLALNGQDTTIDVVGVDCCSPNFVRCGLFGRSSTGQTEYQSTSFRPNLLSGKEAFFVASFASVKARQFIFDFGQYATFGFGVLFKNQETWILFIYVLLFFLGDFCE